MTQEFRVFDSHGKELKVGTKVGWLDNPEYPPGIVESISDFDGDVDDEGREVGINPVVHVVFDDESDDFITTDLLRHNYEGIDHETGMQLEGWPDMVCSDIDSLEDA